MSQLVGPYLLMSEISSRIDLYRRRRSEKFLESEAGQAPGTKPYCRIAVQVVEERRLHLCTLIQ